MDHTMVKSVLLLLWWINDNKQERETVSTSEGLLSLGPVKPLVAGHYGVYCMLQ